MSKLRPFQYTAFLAWLLLFCLTPSHAQNQFANIQNILDEISILSSDAKHSEAAEVGEKWLAINPLTDDADEIVAALLTAIAFNHEKLNQPSKALPLQVRALAIREKVLGPEHADTATSLTSLALTYIQLGQYDQVLPLAVRALAIREKVLGPEHPDTAQSLNNLALTYVALARHDEALPLQVRALAIYEKVLGTEHPDTAESVNILAVTYSALAQYDKALPLQVRALAIYEKVLGAEHRDTALSLNILTWTYRALAQYDKALPLQVRALAINEKVLGPEHPNTAYSLSNLAYIYSSLAQHDKALPLRGRALAIYEKVRGPDHPDTAFSLNNLASTYGALAKHDKALPLQVRALAIYEKVLGPEHSLTAQSLNNLAVTYSALGQYDKALPFQVRALAIYEKVLGPEHRETAVSLGNQALIYNSLAQHEKGLLLQVRSLAIFQKVLGPEHPDTAQSLNNLAQILEYLSHPSAAIALHKSAVNIYQSHRERISGIGTEELRSYTRSISGSYNALARLLVDQGRLAEAQQVLDMLKEDELFEFIRRSSDADPRRTRIGFTADEARWAARYREVADRLAALGVEQRELQQKARRGLTAVEQARLESIDADLDVAEKAFTAFLGEMQRTLKAQGPAKIDEVAATSLESQRELQALIRDLGPDVVLLQYYVTSDKVGMILTTPNVVVPFSTAIDAKALNRQVFQFRNALRDPKVDVIPAAQALYQLLLAPATNALEQAGAKTVMLSLDGQLRHVPFGALHDGKQFAAQRWSMPIYTAVTRDRLREGRPDRLKAAGFGVTRAIGEFKALPAVKSEMDSLPRASGGLAAQNVVYLDEQFTANRLKEVGQSDFQLMHISSHFSISPGTEVNSFLLLGDGQRLTLGDIRTQNYRFDNVDLLTLSACDTGLGGGRDTNGREIEGLGVIAQQQGAKGVLATLWPVADGSTAKLMADMYQRRQREGLSKIEALRQAQLAMMSQKRYAHPFYWAPFILLGNWR